MTRPLVSVSRPPRTLISVVFPEPEGPIRATHSPGLMLKLSASTARSAPYCLVSESMATCDVTLHLEKQMLGEPSLGGAGDTRWQWQRGSSAVRLQDTQSGGVAPLCRIRLCLERWRAGCRRQRQGCRRRDRELPPRRERDAGRGGSHRR